MTQFTTLYSGSSGNSALVRYNDHALLIDVGKSCKATLLAMDSAGVDLSQIQWIAITHDHIDHVRGLQVLLKKRRVPVCASRQTLSALMKKGIVGQEDTLICTDDKVMVQLGDFSVLPFATQHDSEGSQGYVIGTPDGKRIALATDMGVVPQNFYNFVGGCDAVIIESNYDEEMLVSCEYPYYLKRRIKGDFGHLSNSQCAKTVYELYATGVSRFVLAHLSKNSNFPDLAFATTTAYLHEVGVDHHQELSLWVAPRDENLPMIEV